MNEFSIEHKLSPERSSEKIVISENDFFCSQDVTCENYKDRGFVSLDEANKWRESGCGAVCIEMIVKGLKHESLRFGDIVRRGLDLGAYKAGVGWIHSGLVKLFNEFGLDAYRGHFESLGGLKDILEQGNVLILSVTSGFEGGKKIVENGSEYVRGKGGHLVVAFGYKLDQDGKVTDLLINDPDYWPQFQKNSCWVNEKLVANSWSGNAIVVSLL